MTRAILKTITAPVLLVLSMLMQASGQTLTPPVDPSVLPSGVERVDIFLLLGQSNMRGRGAIPPEQTDHPLILNMNLEDRQWYPARHPLHKSGVPDLIDGSDNSGVGPGLDFARNLLGQNTDRMIALVPAARGGSWVNLWQPGRDLYEEAVSRALQALADFPEGKAQIRGVLWLQGESDAQDNRYADYAVRLSNVIAGLRRDLDEPELPFIVCTIGTFIRPEQFNRVPEINELLLTLPDREPFTACVDARDVVGHIGDQLHFDTPSQEIIGRRYAQTFQRLMGWSDEAARLMPLFGEWEVVEGNSRKSRDFGRLEWFSAHWLRHESLGWLFVEPARFQNWVHSVELGWFYTDRFLLPWYWTADSGWSYWRPYDI